MRRVACLTLVLCAAAAGCIQERRQLVGKLRDVGEMPPGYGVMVATFRYYPGASDFAPSQVRADAEYVTRRLSARGYESFVVEGADCAHVGVRASTYDMAASLKESIEAAGVVDLGDGERLPVGEVGVFNLAELKISGVPEAP